MNVLVVDDDPAIRGMVRDLLEGEVGLVVAAEAADGREAIRLAEELQPDAIVLDLMMPNMSGIDALGRIAQVAPRAKIVMLTAYPEAHELVEAASLGASCTMEKTAILKLPDILREVVGE